MEHSEILSTFFKLPIVIKIFVLSIFLWPFYTGSTVYSSLQGNQILLHVNKKGKDHPVHMPFGHSDLI